MSKPQLLIVCKNVEFQCSLSAFAPNAIFCSDPSQLAPLIAKHQPALILIDFFFDGSGSLDIIANLRNDGCAIPIAIISDSFSLPDKNLRCLDFFTL